MILFIEMNFVSNLQPLADDANKYGIRAKSFERLLLLR